MKPIIVAIHGILTGQTNPSWPDRFDAWMFHRDPTVKVLKKEYAAGPFPRWNCFIKDPRLAESIANEVELLIKTAAQPNSAGSHAATEYFPPPTWFLAHSNGAVIALLTVQRLVARGHWVAGVILTGAACEADLARNGVLAALRSGRLGAAIAYCSADDQVLPGPRTARGSFVWCKRLFACAWRALVWPYGSLGRTGWQLHGGPFSPSLTDPEFLDVRTRWFNGGHSTYFAPENMERTFEQVYADAVDNVLALQPLPRRVLLSTHPEKDNR